MSPCDHEEADTRLLVHLGDALKNGCNTCVVRTVDTDVVVILIGKLHHLLSINPSVKIWVAFGTGKHSLTSISILSTILWERTNLWHCLCSTAFQVVIRYQVFW